MTALQALRRDLGAHLAAGLGGADAPIGKTINPPAVTVVGAATYVTAKDYCTDLITFEATIYGPAGDPEAIADALDTKIDLVRQQCATPSPLGRRYQFQGVSGYTTGVNDLPAVIATIAIERRTD